MPITMVCLYLNEDIMRYQCDNLHVNISNRVVNYVLEHICHVHRVVLRVLKPNPQVEACMYHSRSH
jgi:hypothetical protein